MLGYMLNDAILYYASRNDISRNYGKWCNVWVRKFFLMHQGMIYQGSMLSDAMLGQRVLYYTLGNEMFRKYAKWFNSGSFILCIRKWNV